MTTQLVPVEPTEAMLRAADVEPTEYWFGNVEAVNTFLTRCYAAMLKAAPSAPMPEQAWQDYALKSGLLNEHGVASNRFQAQTAYYAFRAAWNLSAYAPPAPAVKAPQVVAEGWKLVPVVITHEMATAWAEAAPIIAGSTANMTDDDANHAWASSDWQAMLAAAPAPPVAPAVNEELLTTLEACKRWHQADTWRNGNQSKKEAWQIHMDDIDAAIARATAATKTGE
jgi:hypothetical protein